jgi:hypothetical protein
MKDIARVERWEAHTTFQKDKAKRREHLEDEDGEGNKALKVYGLDYSG